MDHNYTNCCLNYSSKLEIENCLRLSIFNLNQLGLLSYPSSCTLSSDDGLYNTSFEAELSVIYSEEAIAINLQYNSLGEFIEEVILFTPSDCNLGGKRLWFLCPIRKESNEICHKRVGVLYKPPHNNYFGCRECHNLTYESSKLNTFDRRFGNPDYIGLAKLSKKLKRKFYRGSVTKNYEKYLKKLRSVNSRLYNLQKYLDEK